LLPPLQVQISTGVPFAVPAPVTSRQSPDPRPLGKGQDIRCESVQRIDVDLEQFVARIGLEHVPQGPAHITGRVKRGVREYRLGLAAQIGNRRDGAVIGVRREQPDDAQFALWLALM